jgi:hypothetical protein
MSRKLIWIAVIMPAFLSTGCGLVPSAASCHCTEPCFAADTESAASDQANSAGYCRLCGRGGSMISSAFCRPGLLSHGVGLWCGIHHEAYPTPVEPNPTPAVWSRFHPVPTRPAFEPDPPLLRGEYIGPPPPARVD